MSNVKRDLVRVNINLPSSLVESIKEYADKNGINTTAAYIVLIKQGLDYHTMMDKFPELLLSFQNVSSILKDIKGANEENSPK